MFEPHIFLALYFCPVAAWSQLIRDEETSGTAQLADLDFSDAASKKAKSVAIISLGLSNKCHKLMMNHASTSIFQVPKGVRELLGELILRVERFSCCWAQFRLNNLFISAYSNTLEFLLLQAQKEGRVNSLNKQNKLFILVIHIFMLKHFLLLKERSAAWCMVLISVDLFLFVYRITREGDNLSIYANLRPFSPSRKRKSGKIILSGEFLPSCILRIRRAQRGEWSSVWEDQVPLCHLPTLFVDLDKSLNFSVPHFPHLWQ